MLIRVQDPPVHPMDPRDRKEYRVLLDPQESLDCKALKVLKGLR